MRRRASLKAIFAADQLKKVWKERVWPALRAQGCADLIEYYDYNVTIDSQVRRLSPQIVSGNYRASRSLVLELNKADGLVRRVQIPTPDDSLVFQAIAEHLLTIALAAAPSEKAFFSRSHATPRGIHNMESSPLYPWFKLWPKYQTEILNFTKSKKFLVITDIQNFFDAVPHYAVDSALIYIDVEQDVRDITLYMLENFVQRELYAPLVPKGLPQLDFDAPRLLAHVLLFHMDRYLERKTRGNFARWVDDINFGVDSRNESKDILRTLERFLARIELRLNGSKTITLSRQEAEEHLFVSENLKLTDYQKELDDAKTAIERCEDFYGDFLHFDSKGKQKGHWDQVYRRYINLITKTVSIGPKSKKLAPLRQQINQIARERFTQYTDYRMREALLRLFSTNRMTSELLDFLWKQFIEISKTDDVIAFNIAELLARKELSVTLQKRLTKKFGRASIRPGGMAGLALLLTKYGDKTTIADFIEATKPLWSVNDFLARQVISLWSILSPQSAESLSTRKLLLENVQRGPGDLIRYYETLRVTKTLPAGLEGYVSPANMKRPYTIAKAIIASNLLRSPAIPERARGKLTTALSAVPDPRLADLARNNIHA